MSGLMVNGYLVCMQYKMAIGFVNLVFKSRIKILKVKDVSKNCSTCVYWKSNVHSSS